MRTEISFPGKIRKLGNSYAVIVQKSWAESMGLEPGDDVDVTITVPQGE